MVNLIALISVPVMALASVPTPSIAPLQPVSVQQGADVGVGSIRVLKCRTTNLIGTRPCVFLIPTLVWHVALMMIVSVVSIVTKRGSAHGTTERAVIFVSLVSTPMSVAFSRHVLVPTLIRVPLEAVSLLAPKMGLVLAIVFVEKLRPNGAALIFVCRLKVAPVGVIVIIAGTVRLPVVTMFLVLRANSVMRVSAKISPRTKTSHKMMVVSKRNLSVVASRPIPEIALPHIYGAS